METKKVSVIGLVSRQKREGRPVFAILADGEIKHIGFTTQGFRVYELPAATVAVAFPVEDTIFVREPEVGLPERGAVAAWEHKRDFPEALAALLGVPVQSEAVRELLKRVARFVR